MNSSFPFALIVMRITCLFIFYRTTMFKNVFLQKFHTVTKELQNEIFCDD